MAIVPRHAATVAGSGKSKTALTNWLEAVGVSPNTVELCPQLILKNTTWGKSSGNKYHFVATHDGNNTQALDAEALRVEVVRAQYDVTVNIGVKIRDPELWQLIHEGGLRLSGGIVGTFPAAPVGTITVDVHVCERRRTSDPHYGAGRVGAVGEPTSAGTLIQTVFQDTRTAATLVRKKKYVSASNSVQRNYEDHVYTLTWL